mmetsp:Transcript_48000/g.71134  ORF Transcript_48000/g.71134 Transcript_48000/m.71134 type:complete len:220 (-) Transcript_48000:139-798(-)|eukprot:CAMPEP_0195517492 /NCGR_PEP_ID=MMETSP0794_2-20130614/10975_1 /TAXON_ID=515487 /ORGANISM="Stephanopyxis turris, Strain CCMP 815" /LENGTH=219 /DNA_ID=CAMNT_0040646307 /DNA_START=171 /DNA_END=833 /DNA_ORIENTATION=-
MANFGELVLVLGDMYIPQRACSIPEKFKRMLVPNKMQHVLCTGNLGSRDQYEELRNLAPNVHVVSGDYEYNSPGLTLPSHSHQPNTPNPTTQSAQYFPETKVIQVGEFRIGMIHGHQVVPWGDHESLAMIRRKLDCDVLIYGGTHKNEVVEHDGYYHINPGSITGAFSPASTTKVIPSFVLLAVQGPKVVCYVYELIGDDVDVSKTEFTKQSDGEIMTG